MAVKVPTGIASIEYSGAGESDGPQSFRLVLRRELQPFNCTCPDKLMSWVGPVAVPSSLESRRKLCFRFRGSAASSSSSVWKYHSAMERSTAWPVSQLMGYCCCAATEGAPFQELFALLGSGATDVVAAMGAQPQMLTEKSVFAAYVSFFCRWLVDEESRSIAAGHTSIEDNLVGAADVATRPIGYAKGRSGSLKAVVARSSRAFLGAASTERVPGLAAATGSQASSQGWRLPSGGRGNGRVRVRVGEMCAPSSAAARAALPEDGGGRLGGVRLPAGAGITGEEAKSRRPCTVVHAETTRVVADHARDTCGCKKPAATASLPQGRAASSLGATRLSPGEAGNEATHGGRLSESGVAECPTSFFACSACSRFPAYHTVGRSFPLACFFRRSSSNGWKLRIALMYPMSSWNGPSSPSTTLRPMLFSTGPPSSGRC
eukprot:scaffold731_cov261-Pinguiococcus_pyrenoidosus.AAC.68